MDITRTPGSEYLEFLGNPQKQGVWMTSIQPTSGSTKCLSRLLGIESLYYHPYFRYRQFGDRNDEGTLGAPATIVPHLFTYLRSMLPKSEGEAQPPLFRYEKGFGLYQGESLRRQHYMKDPWHRFVGGAGKASPTKARTLAKAYGVWKKGFRKCTIEVVPEDPSVLDIVSTEDDLYFQVREEADNRLSIHALQAGTCAAVRGLLEALPEVKWVCESRKVLSPETQLLGMYLPSLRLAGPRQIFRDASVLTTIGQTMDEVREGRFVHAIRAVGIGAEELIVEVFETFLHDKAPEVPLGNLLSEMDARIQEVQSGIKPKAKSSLGGVRKSLGTTLGAERKKKAKSNVQICTICEAVLQDIVPLLEGLSSAVRELEEGAAKPQKTILFPAPVNRALSDLVPLRNRVSHRVDRLSSAKTVTYLEASLALKSYVVLALWWQKERQLIDYGVGMKEAIKKSIERNRTQVEL